MLIHYHTKSTPFILRNLDKLSDATNIFLTCSLAFALFLFYSSYADRKTRKKTIIFVYKHHDKQEKNKDIHINLNTRDYTHL
jgi:hypothetical protein